MRILLSFLITTLGVLKSPVCISALSQLLLSQSFTGFMWMSSKRKKEIITILLFEIVFQDISDPLAG